MDGYETLRVEERAGVLRVVLDRPDRHNSINDVMLAELGAVLDRAERGGVPIVALTGTGPVFCSGMDFADASRSGDTSLADRGGAAFFSLLRRFTTDTTSAPRSRARSTVRLVSVVVPLWLIATTSVSPISSRSSNPDSSVAWTASTSSRSPTSGSSAAARL